MKSSTIKIEIGSPLLALRPDQKLSAASGLFSENLSPQQDVVFPPAYARQLIQDLDSLIYDSEERDLVVRSIEDLKSGKARAVVTGQQPGFAGGPLYSLFKIATTVALARLRTGQGQPTVPVFWLGDDDDDWQELLDPVFWDGQAHALIGSDMASPPRSSRLDSIGSLSFSPLEDQTEQALTRWHPADELGQQLQKIYREAKADQSSLSQLTESILRCVFRGTGLIILQGNDPRLHSHCGEFYDLAVNRLPLLVRLTQEQGQGTDHPLSGNSLNRPLYLSNGKSRSPWDGKNLPHDPSTWRCGVLLRSLLQDWLLQPTAVVVGPGELSYLSQLVPAYECMGVARSPLVPRLFGWIVPHGLAPEVIEKFTHDQPLDQVRSQELARIAGAAGEDKLVEILMGELGLDASRAADLAAGRTRRWVKGVQALIQNESQKQVAGSRPSRPSWVFPDRKRQERKLAWIPVAATWGQPFIDAVLQASEKHLQAGAQGCWNEYLLRVPMPDFWRTKGSGS